MDKDGKRHELTIDLALAANTFSSEVVASLRMVWPIQYDEVDDDVATFIDKMERAIADYKKEIAAL